jgi:TonB-linked SusC/RagA family outer membrane protein
MKKIVERVCSFYYGHRKKLLIMRNAVLILLISVFQVLATGSYSQTAQLNLKMKDATIKDVLTEIENQSEFYFLYNSKLIDVTRKVDISVNNEKVNDVLSRLFSKDEVNVSISDRHIVLTPVGEISGQQQKSISGKVTDSSNQPLPGVTVVVKGTTQGTITNADGNYSFTNISEDATLVFSFVGMKGQEIVVGASTTINVVLIDDIVGIDEVIAIGYQTVKRSDLTGSVSVVNPTVAAKVFSNSLAESLQGLASGVTVQNTGRPGQMPRIEIRGAASFTSSDPLYVIDGMIADANQTINNNDIETIQILKDASAAAIYGSRAANGVIIITTKQGKEGIPKVEFSARYGVQNIPNRWDVMDNVSFAAMQKKQYENSGLTPPTSVTSGFDQSVNTDWQEEMLRTGQLQDYNLTLSGGTKTSKYLLSGSYMDNKGVLTGNSFKRGSFRINTSTTRGIVTIGENLLITNSITTSPRDGNPFYDMPQMLPIIPVKSDKYISAINPQGWGIGTNNAVTYAYNSVAVNELTSHRSNYSKLMGNAFAEAKFTDWLTYKFNIGLETSFDFIKNLREDGVWQYNAAVYPSSVDDERSQFLNLLFENTLNFNKTIGKHSLNGVLGISQQHITRENTFAGRTNLQQYNNEYLTTIGSATGAQTSDGGVPTDFRTFGVLGRVNYSYDDRYLVTLTGRRDQDSRFGENFRTGYFPSAAVGWRISKEEFFKIDWISNLKINASYGQLGIVPLGSWDYTTFINSNPRFVVGTGQTPAVGITQAKLANEDLKWEERIVKNIGIDAGLFGNKILFSIEAYNSLSKDALLELPVAGYLGNLGGNPFVNAGSIRNTGFDINLTYKGSANEFKYDVSASFTTINNTVEDVGSRGKDAEGKSIDYIQVGNTRTQIGRSMGEWFLLKTDGLFQSQEEINSYVNKENIVIQPFARPGDVKYLDLNGDGQINNDDRDFTGSPWPKLQAGAQFNAYYKGFSLNMQFVGVFGTQIYNDVRRILDSYQRSNFRSDINPWSPDNTNTSDPRIGVDTQQGIIMNNYGQSDRWLENGSYVRLRNIELGYTLPESFTTKVKIQNVRLSVSGQNLLTFTNYSGLDPDVIGNGLYERGLDNGTWPSNKVLIFGIHCEF